MRRTSGVLAFMAGAALIVTTTGAAVGQEESAPPEASMAPEASPEAEMIGPSTLEIIDVAADRSAAKPLVGKKLQKAAAKAAPDAALHVVGNTGEDAIGRIIGLSLAAREADEAGDAKTAKALIDIAKLVYRNEWTTTKSDHVALDAAITEAIAADYPEKDPALVLWAGPEEQLIGFVDVCVWPDGTESHGASTEAPLCADDRGRWARVDDSLIDWDKNSSTDFYAGDPETADAGGLGIHKVTQDGAANEKLAGKKYKKALAKELKKSGASIVGFEPGERGVIEMVLAARAADEAGDQKAAKAYMELALAAYRASVPEPDVTGEYNESIVRLVNEQYAELPGLELWPPEGMIDVCLKSNGKYVTCVDQASPWECWEAGGKKLERMSMEDAPCG